MSRSLRAARLVLHLASPFPVLPYALRFIPHSAFSCKGIGYITALRLGQLLASSFLNHSIAMLPGQNRSQTTPFFQCMTNHIDLN
jgi:hypothetical protein